MRNEHNEQFETPVVSTGIVMVPSTSSDTGMQTGSGTEDTPVVEPVETTEGTTFNKI
jgi:hypothetical protein